MRRTAFLVSFAIIALLGTAGCDELAMPPEPGTAQNTAPPPTDQGTGQRMLGPGLPDNPAGNAEKMRDPSVEEAGPVERQRAAAGVGRQGRKYGGGVVSEPVRQYFRASQQIVFDISIPMALRHYEALDPNGKGPQTQEAFLKMLEENGITLPDLPPGEKYVWDVEAQELLVERPAPQTP